MNAHPDQGLNADVARALAESAHLRIDPGQLEYLSGYPRMGGGFGTVKVARLGDQIVAVKELRIAGDDDDRARFSMRFARELKIWAPLDHPNLLKLSGFYLDPEMFIAQFICPFYPHGHIRKYTEANQPNQETRIRLAQDTALGLQHLHKLQIVHGDIKELSVLVHPEPRALLCDYGLAKMISPGGTGSGLTTTGNPMSFRFASPEILHGSQPNFAADVWAWGCLLLMVVTDIAPHNGTPDMACVTKVITGVPPADVLVLAIPDILRNMLDRCWKNNPKARPSIDECVAIINSPIYMKILEGHTGSVRSVAFSPDGSLLASASDDWDVRVWDVTSNHLEATLRCSSVVHTIAFSPDGWRLALGLDSGVQIWGAIPDESTVSGVILTWIKLNSVPTLTSALAVALSPDNSHLAIVQPFYTTVVMLNPPSGMLLKMLGSWSISASNSGCVLFSPNGVWLAYSRAGYVISIADENTFNQGIRWHFVAELAGHTERVNSVAFVPNTSWLASGSDDCTIRIWDVPSRTVLLVLEIGGSVKSFGLSLDGRRLASLKDTGDIQLWDIPSKKLLKNVGRHTQSFTSVAWSPDDKWIACGSMDGKVRMEPAPWAAAVAL